MVDEVYQLALIKLEKEFNRKTFNHSLLKPEYLLFAYIHNVFFSNVGSNEAVFLPKLRVLISMIKQLRVNWARLLVNLFIKKAEERPQGLRLVFLLDMARRSALFWFSAFKIMSGLTVKRSLKTSWCLTRSYSLWWFLVCPTQDKEIWWCNQETSPENASFQEGGSWGWWCGGSLHSNLHPIWQKGKKENFWCLNSSNA